MSAEPVLVAVASGSEDLTPTLIEKMRAIRPDLPLYVVSEFRVEGAAWIPYHLGRTLEENLALCRSALRDKQIVFVGIILQPRMPYWTMRWMGVRLGGLNTIYFNENLDHFLLRPRSLGAVARHLLWRARNFVRWELQPGGATYTMLWRLAHPKAFLRPLQYRVARAAGWFAFRQRARPAEPVGSAVYPRGISVVIPSRNGRDLLARLMPTLVRELAGRPSEIIVVDNGSDDGTVAWLAAEYPQVRIETSAAPLSFARAVNRGIAAAGYSHLLMLNNDMVLDSGFFPPLEEAFRTVPDLFCATAQILFPEGVRREETGKAVMPAKRNAEDFPVRCDLPLEGENASYVLYGSGGCSLFDTGKLKSLGGLDEIYEPAYVEDLDLGFRGWQRGWPTVFVAGARVEHRHRATTSRYYDPRELDRVLEVNYLKFTAGTASDPKLWREAIERLNRRAATMTPDPAAKAALGEAWRAPQWARRRTAARLVDAEILAIGSGDVAVFPGKAASGKPRVLVASPYIPFPLSHGGAVRIYNLFRRGAADFDQVLVCFVNELATPPREVLDIAVEVVLVRLESSHLRPLTDRPSTVDEYDSLPFRMALRLMMKKWRPAVAQLEFTQMALYASECAPAKTVLVEHDVTYDLYQQMLARGEDWETRQQYERWVRFEKAAWAQVDRVVVMSGKDREAVAIPNALVLANGVDLEHFQSSAPGGPATLAPEGERVLFIGSFAHLPNLLAVDFFLREVWPAVRAKRPGAVFHIIAGSRHQFFLERYADKVQPPLATAGVEVEDFVSDPRIAYRRAAVVVAPLLASAGTNIKIMEAMAMGKAIVSTPAGINGLDDLRDGHDVIVSATAPEMAEAVARLLGDAKQRHAIEREARKTVERSYGWDAIAGRQRLLYEELGARSL
ncbi:MAG: glycosyltransferase [Bryobacteraceae bacterium]